MGQKTPATKEFKPAPLPVRLQAKSVGQTESRCVLSLWVAASPFVSESRLSSLHSATCALINPTYTLWCAAARLSGDGPLAALIDSVVLVMTLW
jgi:hypothetical protein